jgi:hypothetical protein
MLPRRTLLLAFLLAGCASSPPPSYPPLRYDYLTPLRLNVGTIDIVDTWQPVSAADVGGDSLAQPAATLEQMGRDRLKPAGASGRAVFTIDDASLIQDGDTVTGTFSVELDIIDGSGARVAYAEARAVRRQTGIADGGRKRADQLYALVKQLMDAMNVELEYQVRRSLRGWLVAGNAGAAPAVGAVSQQPLVAPPLPASRRSVPQPPAPRVPTY